jgi:hypothetical protein
MPSLAISPFGQFKKINNEIDKFSSIKEFRSKNLCKKHSEKLFDKLTDDPILKNKASINKYGLYSILINLLFPDNFDYKFSFKIDFSPDIYLYLNKIKENKNPYYIKCTLIDITDIPLPHSFLPDDKDFFFEEYNELITKINEIRNELIDKNSLDANL